VAAIVLRVDSPGGDGLASDLIYREVLEARKRKPVVASMGDLAASGGYYVAAGADEIFALPTTLTGSIGVFVVKPSIEGLGEKLGIHAETLQRGPMAGLFNLWRPWTPEEQKAAQAWSDAFYEDFIGAVSASRHLPRDQVDAVARGRIWSGEDALQRHLVDRMGGLLDAVDAARERAHLSRTEDVALVEYGAPHGLFQSLGGEPGVLAGWLGVTASPQMPEGLQALARSLELDPATLTRTGLQARLPFNVQVR
jgi:protease-4